MDVKFILKAECRLDNIDHKADSNTKLAKELEQLFEDIGMKAVVEISGLTYINEAENEG